MTKRTSSIAGHLALPTTLFVSALLMTACGGGGGSAGVATTAGASTEAIANADRPATEAVTTQDNVVPNSKSDTAADENSVTSTEATPELAPFTIRRVFDTINPLATGGELNLELPKGTIKVFVRFALQKPDGTLVKNLSTLDGSDGSFYPKSAEYAKLSLIGILPGSYLLKATSQDWDPVTNAVVERSSTLPMDVQGFHLPYASLSYNPGIIIRGSSRLLPIEYSSVDSGKLYVYPLGQALATCTAKNRQELEAMPSVQQHPVTGSLKSVSSTYLPAAVVADADTVCFQFVPEGSEVGEAPYTFNVRMLKLPASGSLSLPLDADVSTVNKSSLGLLSMPTNTRISGMYDWIDRRALFTSGDRHQQSTSNSERITLEQRDGKWEYSIASPAAGDHPFYVATVEGRAPMAFFVQP